MKHSVFFFCMLRELMSHICLPKANVFFFSPSRLNPSVIRLYLNILPEQKLLMLMVLLEWSELRSHSFPSSSENWESDRGEDLLLGLKGWSTRRGMRLRGLPFSGDFFSCSKTTYFAFVFTLHTSLFFLNIKCGKKYNSPHILGMDPLCFTLCFRLIIKQKTQISELHMWQHFAWHQNSWQTRTVRVKPLNHTYTHIYTHWYNWHSKSRAWHFNLKALSA